MTDARKSALAIFLTAVLIAILLVVRAVVISAPMEMLTENSESWATSYTGSLSLPRGGPYVLGYEANQPAKLYIDDVLILQGEGIQKKRIVYQPGHARLKIESKGSVRLLWHPPGRRGPLEYVPASSLSSDQENPTFHRPGTSIGDGLIAVGIVLAILACLGFLARRSIVGCNRRVLWSSISLLAFAFLVRLYAIDAAGQTWDEDVNWSAGRNYITNLLSLDFSESSWRWNYEHPPVMKYLAGIGAQFSDGYSVSRGISAFLGAAACMLLVPIGARLSSLRVGVMAAAFAALTPHLIAHSKVVGHEAPTMFFWTLAIWLSLRAHDASDDPYRLHKRMAALGVVLGLAIFSRYINGLLAPLIGCILLIQAPQGQRKKTILLGFSVLLVAMVVTCFVIWPRMWSHPITHLQESWTKLKKPHGVEPYLGVLTDAPGRSYFFVYLWATAPLGLLVFAKLFVARVIHWRERGAGIVLLWLLIPIVVTFSPVRQDGVRYIMPSILALNMMAALSVDYLIQVSSRFFSHRFGEERVCIALGTALCLYLLIVCTRIHPFYLDYYGEQVGGPKSVAAGKRFEIAWWGEGMNEALNYLNENAPPNAKVYKRCFEPGHLAWMRGDLWQYEARRPQDAEWFLVYQPTVRGCPIPKDATLVFEATAQGAPLSRVYQRILPQR